jgi:hypothetical protein
MLVELAFGKQPSQSYDMDETLGQLSQILNTNKNNKQDKSFFHLIKQCLSQVCQILFLFFEKHFSL